MLDRTNIEIFTSDYDTLLLRAGTPHDIAFVVRNLIELSDAIFFQFQGIEQHQDIVKKAQG